MENHEEMSSELIDKRQSFLDQNNFRTIAVIGAGIIGAGIAHVSINKDYKVILHDTTSKALLRGQSQISKGYENSIKRKRITQ
jgi:enoyl-CoA hydratase/long-chain 3-hydroxyacyl-CoA dehydrogenase